MEVLAMAWMLDSRWFCKVNNCLSHYLFMVPILVDLSTVTGVLIERQSLHL